MPSLEHSEGLPLVPFAQTVQRHELGIVVASTHVVAHDDATPVVIALRSEVILVVQVTRTGDEPAVCGAADDLTSPEPKPLLVPHGERSADGLDECVHRLPRERTASHTVSEVV